MHTRNAAAPDERSETVDVADDALLALVLDHANQFVRQLRLPVEQHHLYDDIVQDTMIVAHRNLTMLRTLELGPRCGWIKATMFLVARNTQRAELRRTTTWERLRDAFHRGSVRRHFDQAGDDRSDHLAHAFVLLNDLDRELLVSQVWNGLTTAELATQHGLTPAAVRNRLTRVRSTVRQILRESLAEPETNDGRADIHR